MRLHKPTTLGACNWKSSIKHQASSIKHQVASAIAASFLAIVSASATGATIKSVEHAQLTAQARKDGAAPVVVHLAPSMLAELQKDLAGVKKKMGKKAKDLLAELGQEVWQGGRSDGGIGQISMYVTPRGLQILQRTGNAVSFYPDMSWQKSTHLFDPDGSLAAVEQRLTADGFVDVTVTMNVDGLDFDVGPDGRSHFKGDQLAQLDFGNKAQALLQTLAANEVHDKSAAELAVAQAVSKADQFNPQVTMRVSRAGLIKLSHDKTVRKIEPLGFDRKAANPRRVSDEVFVEAQKNGGAQVLLQVSVPWASGGLSAKSVAAQLVANRRSIDDVLQRAQVTSTLNVMPHIGVVAGRMSHDELMRLKDSTDGRIEVLMLDKPMAKPGLATSTTTLKMPLAWDAGLTAAGQTIAIFDMGVEKAHPFFRKSTTGTESRVTIGACFGTNLKDANQNVLWESKCPNQDPATGDSRPGTPNAGEPPMIEKCALPASSGGVCMDHGTNVAGIAAGGRKAGNVIPAGLQGVAPDANIAAIQVMSFRPNGGGPSSLPGDQLAALQAILAITQENTYNPITINMSLGSIESLPYNGTECSDWQAGIAYKLAVKGLVERGVPIIAITQNDGKRDRIAFPACVNGVIKVGSMVNKDPGTELASHTNLASHDDFPGETFWLAPGGGVTTDFVKTSTPSNYLGGPWKLNNGTSMAAPHVAGLYAVLKAAVPGISVPEANKWFKDNASQEVTVIVEKQKTNGITRPETFLRLQLRPLVIH